MFFADAVPKSSSGLFERANIENTAFGTAEGRKRARMGWKRSNYSIAA